jgi:hypothetical protein
MKRELVLRVAVFALAEFAALSGPACAQEPGSPAWQQLRQHPSTWPPQVTLKADVQLTITDSTGRQIGSLGAPTGSVVQLLSVDPATLRIGVGAAQAAVPPESTDLAERLAARTAGPLPSPNTAPETNLASFAPAAPSPPASAPPAAPSPPPVAATLRDPASAPVLPGSPMQFDYEAGPSDGYDKAAFRFWSPPYAQPLRGLIIMTPGSDQDGRGMVNDKAWQTLARKYALGLVASFLQGHHYQRPEDGTGNALRAAMRHFAGQAGHPEIVTVPLLLWGVSAGGQWNYNYMLWRPEDVMAFVVNKGGYYNEAEPDSHAYAVPGLFILGQADEAFRITAITGRWTQGRKAGALWALAPQPKSGHEFSKTDPLGRVFFEAVLKARLPESSALSADTTDTPPMRAMQENAGWLGNLGTHEIHDDSTDGEIDRNAAWLPDEKTAQAWKVFVSGG